jgi:Ca2+-binding EF-hand superfamily protein
LQWEQYQEFLIQKKTTLEEQIMAVRFHGVPLEQIAEVEDTFNQFDADQNGYILSFAHVNMVFC